MWWRICGAMEEIEVEDGVGSGNHEALMVQWF